MTPTKLNESIIDVLDDLKARDILAIDIQKFTSIADFMIICTATSDRHLKAVFTHLTQELKENNIIPISSIYNRISMLYAISIVYDTNAMYLVIYII